MQYQGAESRRNIKAKEAIAAEELEHQELVRILMSLPEFLAIALWTPQQKAFFESEKKFWNWLGKRLDYLQKHQNGFLPVDPVTQVRPEVQQHLEIHSQHLFEMLQVVVEHFGVIAKEAKNQGRPFHFANPRELFAEICREFSSYSIQPATSREIGVGGTMNEIREVETDMGKFYRESLKSERSPDYGVVRQQLINSCSWAELAIASVTGLPASYLRKSAGWKKFIDSHKNLTKYLKSAKNLGAVRWNCGRPVRADTNEPLVFDLPPS